MKILKWLLHLLLSLILGLWGALARIGKSLCALIRRDRSTMPHGSVPDDLRSDRSDP